MRKRIIAKLAVLGCLSLILTGVLASIEDLVRERQGRHYQVQQNIAESYAGAQQLIGPVVAIEFRESWVDRLYNKEKDTWYDRDASIVRTKLFYPDVFNYEGSLDVQERYRGIFKANVFQSSGHLNGSFSFPAFETLALRDNSSVELLSAKACMLIDDPRGITRIPGFSWNNSTLVIKQGSGVKSFNKGFHSELPDIKSLFSKQFTFDMNLDIHGVGQFDFVPVGSTNQIKLKSAWPHPSFVGDFLASERTVGSDGFSAEWNVNGLACSAQQMMDNGRFERLQHLGVNLIDPVSAYSLSDRALKYGFLFIFITFSAFFLFELVKQLKIHPVQYGFVGLAQAIFFLLLLSLSEHINFGAAYLVASLANIAVVAIYLCSVLEGFGRGLLFGSILSLLYGALYGLLRSEDHALVAGSVLLFGLLTITMLITRRVDWYALGNKREDVLAK